MRRDFFKPRRDYSGSRTSSLLRLATTSSSTSAPTHAPPQETPSQSIQPTPTPLGQAKQASFDIDEARKRPKIS